MNIPPTRINMVEEIERALKLLTSQGYETSQLWTEHATWAEQQGVPAITDFDRTWARRAALPSVMEDHFEEGTAEILTANQAFKGRQYTLSSGMREILRERYGLTPTVTVVLDNVASYREEATVIWSITLRSTEHIDPRRRRVLSSVVLAPASKFFYDAAIIDAAKVEADDADAEASPKKKRTPNVIDLALKYL